VTDALGSDRRRRFRHMTFDGFALCIAATVVATLYRYVLHRDAPYAWYEVPMLLGLREESGSSSVRSSLRSRSLRSDGDTIDTQSRPMEFAFLTMLLLSGGTGMLFLAFRQSIAMPMLMAVHLGVVAALFVTMPYGKFVHGIFGLLRW
jgi:citrate/tricarballylate utilization protein